VIVAFIHVRRSMLVDEVVVTDEPVESFSDVNVPEMELPDCVVADVPDEASVRLKLPSSGS
jgi:hypothetical protein